jgi:hypothetical protein
MGPDITAFFDDATNTISYVVRDPNGSACAIIDSVLDFDFASGRTDTQSADKLINFVTENKLDVKWLLESHVHADHLSAAPYIQMKVGGKIGIGSRITDVQERFGKIFNEGTEFQRDGSQFDKLFFEGDTFHIGQLRGDVLHTPGHTPACLTYVIEMLPLLVILCLCLTLEQQDAISQADLQKGFFHQFKKYWSFLMQHVFLWVTITKHLVETIMLGKLLSVNKRKRIFISNLVNLEMILLNCEMNATQNLRCQSLSYPHSR